MSLSLVNTEHQGSSINDMLKHIILEKLNIKRENTLKEENEELKKTNPK